MPICAYRLCDNEFEKNIRGWEKKYCCVKHSKAERRLRLLEKQSEQDMKTKIFKKKKDAVRIEASLKCIHYQECLFGIRMNCHKGDRKELKADTWMHEP